MVEFFVVVFPGKPKPDSEVSSSDEVPAQPLIGQPTADLFGSQTASQGAARSLANLLESKSSSSEELSDEKSATAAAGRTTATTITAVAESAGLSVTSSSGKLFP